jgi:hypothetical protein
VSLPHNHHQSMSTQRMSGLSQSLKTPQTSMPLTTL